ncbi:MAG: hypothetical protein PHF86_03945 [Candidatus Nanoarchaeia archaeon]|nr:hypothetical protein [Candidatus Nanoarchaeia archaeon]
MESLEGFMKAGEFDLFSFNYDLNSFYRKVFKENMPNLSDKLYFKQTESLEDEKICATYNIESGLIKLAMSSDYESIKESLMHELGHDKFLTYNKISKLTNENGNVIPELYILNEAFAYAIGCAYHLYSGTEILPNAQQHIKEKILSLKDEMNIELCNDRHKLDNLSQYYGLYLAIKYVNQLDKLWKDYKDLKSIKELDKLLFINTLN